LGDPTMTPGPSRLQAQFANYQIADNHETAHNPHMSIRVTGSQIAAARTLAGLTRHELAERAGLSYHSIRAWERSSNGIPEATYSYLCRAFEALEDAGVRFTDGGVQLQRSTPAGTVIQSERAVA
jgi:DNA-binding transcriptional regulator YiaG